MFDEWIHPVSFELKWKQPLPLREIFDLNMKRYNADFKIIFKTNQNCKGWLEYNQKL